MIIEKLMTLPPRIVLKECLTPLYLSMTIHDDSASICYETEAELAFMVPWHEDDFTDNIWLISNISTDEDFLRGLSYLTELLKQYQDYFQPFTQNESL